MVIILTFLIILSIGAVSASEDSDNALSFSNDNSILEATPGTFTDLASDLSGKTEVTLERNYTYVTEDNLVNGIGINSEITIDGAGYTINGSDLARIFIITGENYQITLKNINFVNGKSDKGGAILQNANNQAIDISVINCTFKYNDVTGSGGAIYARSTGKFIFENNTFENNTANAVGALYAPKAEGLYYNNTFINNTASTGNGGAVQLGDNTIVNKSTFKNNRAAKNGGGLNIGKNSKVLNSNFTNNSAEQGGAIYAGEECTVLNCLFDGNNATNHAGAVLVALNSQISYSNFTNNIATNNGGGLNTAANCNVSYCNFNENSANQGGAIYSGEKAAILNCTFEGNDAYVGGGAIYLSKNSNVLNCNFTQNEVIVDPTIVAKGGAIFINQNANNVNITNCRFIENEAYSGAAIRLEAAYINISHSVFEENHAHGGKINDVNTVEAGAILIQDPGKCTLVEYCNFTSNYANATGHKDSYGGAIRNRAQNTTINHCNFISNIAYHNAGGAIESSGANLKINDSYFEDNTAHSDGGALYLHASANDVVLITNSRFVNNRVSEDQPCKTGGAILLRQPGNNVLVRPGKCLVMATTHVQLPADHVRLGIQKCPNIGSRGPAGIDVPCQRVDVDVGPLGTVFSEKISVNLPDMIIDFQTHSCDSFLKIKSMNKLVYSHLPYYPGFSLVRSIQALSDGIFGAFVGCVDVVVVPVNDDPTAIITANINAPVRSKVVCFEISSHRYTPILIIAIFRNTPEFSRVAVRCFRYPGCSFTGLSPCYQLSAYM